MPKPTILINACPPGSWEYPVTRDLMLQAQRPRAILTHPGEPWRVNDLPVVNLPLDNNGWPLGGQPWRTYVGDRGVIPHGEYLLTFVGKGVVRVFQAGQAREKPAEEVQGQLVELDGSGAVDVRVMESSRDNPVRHVRLVKHDEPTGFLQPWLHERVGAVQGSRLMELSAPMHALRFEGDPYDRSTTRWPASANGWSIKQIADAVRELPGKIHWLCIAPKNVQQLVTLLEGSGKRLILEPWNEVWNDLFEIAAYYSPFRAETRHAYADAIVAMVREVRRLGAEDWIEVVGCGQLTTPMPELGETWDTETGGIVMAKQVLDRCAEQDALPSGWGVAHYVGASDPTDLWGDLARSADLKRKALFQMSELLQSRYGGAVALDVYEAGWHPDRAGTPQVDPELVDAFRGAVSDPRGGQLIRDMLADAEAAGVRYWAAYCWDRVVLEPAADQGGASIFGFGGGPSWQIDARTSPRWDALVEYVRAASAGPVLPGDGEVVVPMPKPSPWLPVIEALAKDEAAVTRLREVLES